MAHIILPFPMKVTLSSWDAPSCAEQCQLGGGGWGEGCSDEINEAVFLHFWVVILRLFVPLCFAVPLS